jgi:hypothetical protein
MLPNKRHQYYVNDDVTFRGSFEIDGTAQTPDADTCLCTIMKNGTTTPIVNGAAGTIQGTQLTYKKSDLEVGQYAIFLTAKFNSGADERTGIIECVVLAKEAN